MARQKWTEEDVEKTDATHAETGHSAADTLNWMLNLFGVEQDHQIRIDETPERPIKTLKNSEPTFTDLIRKAAEYSTGIEFREQSIIEYKNARSRGVLKYIWKESRDFRRSLWGNYTKTNRTKEKSVNSPFTYLYVYLHPEGLAYVGITNDINGRHEQHLQNTTPTNTQFLAQDSEPQYFERYVEYKYTFEPYAIEDRKTAERLERWYIRQLGKSGWKLINKTHNKQYDHTTGEYIWENRPLPWCDFD